MAYLECAPYVAVCYADVTLGGPSLSSARPRIFSAPRNIINDHTQQPLLSQVKNNGLEMSQHTVNSNNNFSNNANSFNVWNNCTFADDRSQLLAWLSPLEPSLRHRDVRERRINNVGEWLMQTEEFRRWCGRSGEGEGGGDTAVLFCYGDPGVGKTFIR